MWTASCTVHNHAHNRAPILAAALFISWILSIHFCSFYWIQFCAFFFFFIFFILFAVCLLFITWHDVVVTCVCSSRILRLIPFIRLWKTTTKKNPTKYMYMYLCVRTYVLLFLLFGAPEVFDFSFKFFFHSSRAFFYRRLLFVEISSSFSPPSHLFLRISKFFCFFFFYSLVAWLSALCYD